MTRVLFIFLILANLGISEFSQQTYLAKLSLIIDAKSAEELTEGMISLEKTSINRKACFRQIGSVNFPSFCYLFYRSQKKLDLKFKQVSLKLIDSICAKSLEKIKSLKEISKSWFQMKLSPNCLENLKNRRDELIYSSMELNPLEVLQYKVH